MDPVVEQFRQRAEECRRAARSTRDKAGRTHWETMARRWERCIEAAKLTGGEQRPT